MKAKPITKPKIVLTAHNSSSKTSPEDYWTVFQENVRVGHIIRTVITRDTTHPYKIFVGVGDTAMCIGSLTGGFRRAINCLTEALS